MASAGQETLLVVCHGYWKYSQEHVLVVKVVRDTNSLWDFPGNAINMSRKTRKSVWFCNQELLKDRSSCTISADIFKNRIPRNVFQKVNNVACFWPSCSSFAEKKWHSFTLTYFKVLTEVPPACFSLFSLQAGTFKQIWVVWIYSAGHILTWLQLIFWTLDTRQKNKGRIWGGVQIQSHCENTSAECWELLTKLWKKCTHLPGGFSQNDCMLSPSTAWEGHPRSWWFKVVEVGLASMKDSGILFLSESLQ